MVDVGDDDTGVDVPAFGVVADPSVVVVGVVGLPLVTFELVPEFVPAFTLALLSPGAEGAVLLVGEAFDDGDTDG